MHVSPVNQFHPLLLAGLLAKKLVLVQAVRVYGFPKIYRHLLKFQKTRAQANQFVEGKPLEKFTLAGDKDFRKVVKGMIRAPGQAVTSLEERSGVLRTLSEFEKDYFQKDPNLLQSVLYHTVIKTSPLMKVRFLLVPPPSLSLSLYGLFFLFSFLQLSLFFFFALFSWLVSFVALQIINDFRATEAMAAKKHSQAMASNREQAAAGGGGGGGERGGQHTSSSAASLRGDGETIDITDAKTTRRV